MRTTWQQRMKADLETRGYAPRTQDHYFTAARRFVTEVGRGPERIGQSEIRTYFDKARKEKARSEAWLKLQMAGVRFLFAVTLGHPERVTWIQWPRHHAPLPMVLSGVEIQRLLAALSSPLYRAVAMTMYGAGLRISEACVLEVTDIDSTRGLIHVRKGKGANLQAHAAT